MKLAYTYTYKCPSIMHVYIAYLYILYIYTLYLSSKYCDPCTRLIIYIFQLNLFRNFWHDTEFFMPILHLSNKFVKMTSIFVRTLRIHIIAMIVLSCVVKKTRTNVHCVWESRPNNTQWSNRIVTHDRGVSYILFFFSTGMIVKAWIRARKRRMGKVRNLRHAHEVTQV